MRTLLFCTSYAETHHEWDSRWGMWLKAISQSGLRFDQLLIVDDGSPTLPNWPDVETVQLGIDKLSARKACLHHFQDRLGRKANGQPFPGWYRSFAHAVGYGIDAGFDRIIHVESDAFLLSRRAVDFFNTCSRGWVAMWCPTHRWPESTLQVINRDSFSGCADFFSQPYSAHLTKPYSPIEKLLPITTVDKSLVGDRYGELGDTVPYGADYVSQIRWGQPEKYYWWLNDVLNTQGGEMATLNAVPLTDNYERVEEDLKHGGVDYLSFFTFLDRELCPEGYLEIGTEEGNSLSRISCDAICIDPMFRLNKSVIGRREKMLFFQSKSDEFFRNNDPRHLLSKIDLAFLDGLHMFEALLRDFINFERSSHPNSLAILHDCLPLNTRMTSRDHLLGPTTEDVATKGFWTGDVWKVLPILKQYRPDLNIVLVDCPPTGLVLCRGMNRESGVLADSFKSIVDQFKQVTLDAFGLETLWRCFPLLDSRRIMEDPRAFCELYRFRI